MYSITERHRTLLVLNGIGLLISSALTGWFYFFHLLGDIDLWPILNHIEFKIGGDPRAWNMAHMEGITQGLMLMAIAACAPFIKLSALLARIMFYSALITGWMFTLPAIANAIFDTRGLSFDGGPFAGGLANSLIFLSGWPPITAVHVLFGLLFYGVWTHYKSLKTADEVAS